MNTCNKSVWIICYPTSRTNSPTMPKLRSVSYLYRSGHAQTTARPKAPHDVPPDRPTTARGIASSTKEQAKSRSANRKLDYNKPPAFFPEMLCGRRQFLLNVTWMKNGHKTESIFSSLY